MKNLIILGGGNSKRMNFRDPSTPKCALPILGKPIIKYVVGAAKKAGFDNIVIITSPNDEVTSTLVDECIKVVKQDENCGSGKAILAAKEVLKEEAGTTVIMYADMPLLTGETLSNMMYVHEKNNADLTVATAYVDHPNGLSVVIRDDNGKLIELKNYKDIEDKPYRRTEIFGGIMVAENNAVYQMAEKLLPHQNNLYYVADLLATYNLSKKKVIGFLCRNAEETMVISDRAQASFASMILRRQINMTHMANGVTIEDPTSTYIYPDVKIGKDSVIRPNTTITGVSNIGEGNIIGPNSYLEDVEIGNDNKIISSYLTETSVGDNNEIGPFTKTRAHTKIDNNCRIGNFVELKNAHYNEGVKTAHLTYIGDAEVGEHTNIGCMTVTANYDGYNKEHTEIGKNVFVGSGSILVAPVTLQDESFTAAGSVITSEVKSGEMAIARARQVNKENLRNVFLAKAKAKKEAKANK